MDTLMIPAPAGAAVHAPGASVLRSVGDAFPGDTYDRLAADFPDMALAEPPKVRPGDPHVDYHRYRVTDQDDPNLAPSWRDFWSYALGGSLLAELLAAWRGELDRWYPDLPLDVPGYFRVSGQFLWRAGPEADLGLRPHCDGQRDLFVAMWYFPLPGDESTGGTLRFLCRAGSAFSPTFKAWLEVPYRANTGAVLLNTPTAIHDVTGRPAGSPPRRAARVLVSVPKGVELFPVLSPDDLAGTHAPGVGIGLYCGPARRGRKAAALREGRELVEAVLRRSMRVTG